MKPWWWFRVADAGKFHMADRFDYRDGKVVVVGCCQYANGEHAEDHPDGPPRLADLDPADVCQRCKAMLDRRIEWYRQIADALERTPA